MSDSNQTKSDSSSTAKRSSQTEKIEFLKLSANCCYNSCIGCSSLRKLRDFRGQWPSDWQMRLKGSARLQKEAIQAS